MSVEYRKNSDESLTPIVNGEVAPFVVYQNGKDTILEMTANDHAMEPKRFTKPSALSDYVEAATNYLNSKKAK